MRFIAVVRAVGLLIFAVTAPSVAQTEVGGRAQAYDERKVPILDSRYRARSFGALDPQFFWINNDEILFLNIKVLPDSRSPNNENVSYVVSRWNTRSNDVSIVRDFGGDDPRICYHDGEVLYQVRRRDGSLVGYHGKPGEAGRKVNPSEYGRSICRPLNKIPTIPDWMRDREARRLERLNDGFLDFGERQKSMENTPVRLYRYGEDQQAGKVLPFGRREISWRLPYYEFKDAYFVESHYPKHPRPPEVPYPVFWLYRNGHVEKIAEIPWGPWRSSASFFVFPVKQGLILYSHNARNESDIGHAGLYLLRERVERVVKGWVIGAAVAPDGCRFAFTYAPNMTRKGNVLQVMNLCAGG